LPFFSIVIHFGFDVEKALLRSFEGQAAAAAGGGQAQQSPPPSLCFLFFCFFAGPEKWKANWRVESGPGQASSERRNHRSGMQQIFEIPLFHMPKLFQEKLRQDNDR